MEHFDAIVIGGGLSGIAAGYRLQYDLKDKTYVILEGRDTIGGTWDLFRFLIFKSQ
jgi:cation diffusion facilitator CzcD-associated flavoprotein CzcO